MAWSEIILTERQSGPSRLGADFGAPRTRGAAPAPPAGLGVCWSPRRPCIVGVNLDLGVRTTFFLDGFFSLFSAKGGEVEYVGIPTYSNNFPKSDVFRIKFSSLREFTE